MIGCILVVQVQLFHQPTYPKISNIFSAIYVILDQNILINSGMISTT